MTVMTKTNDTPNDQVQPEVEQIATILVQLRPPGTERREVWDEAQRIHRQRSEHKSRYDRLLL